MIKIGIYIKDISYNGLFNNGCNQQSYFIFMLLNNIPKCTCLFISDKGVPYFNQIPLKLDDVEQIYTLDAIIGISKVLSDKPYLEKLVEHNVKLIEYNCGNIYYMLNENIIYSKYVFKIDTDVYKYYTSQWHIPNYKKDIEFYKEITQLTDVHTVPYIWDPFVLHNWIHNHTDISYTIENNNLPMKYILILEPNLQTTKTCLLPLLICNKLYNDGYKNIQVLLFCNPKTESFSCFCNNLSIYKDGKINMYNRVIFYEILQKIKDKAVYILSHQRDNPLNFIHLETLYLNYPLIHNTNEYSNVGYHYTTISEGVYCLLDAFTNHIDNIEHYKVETTKLIRSFSPNLKNNISIYKDFIDNLLH